MQNLDLWLQKPHLRVVLHLPCVAFPLVTTTLTQGMLLFQTIHTQFFAPPLHTLSPNDILFCYYRHYTHDVIAPAAY
jgi:hypothetical protein